MAIKEPSKRTTIAFALAAFVGLGAALFSALGLSFEARDSAAVAYVNGAPIPQAEYIRALDAMQASLDRTLTEADKARALQILIDEELIIQEALRLDLASDDRLVRKNLTRTH